MRGGGLNSGNASTVGDDDEADVPLTFGLLDWLRDGGKSTSVAEEGSVFVIVLIFLFGPLWWGL